MPRKRGVRAHHSGEAGRPPRLRETDDASGVPTSVVPTAIWRERRVVVLTGERRTLGRLGGRAPEAASALARRSGGAGGLAARAVDERVRTLGAPDGRVEGPPLPPLLHIPVAVRRRKDATPLVRRLRVRRPVVRPRAPTITVRLKLHTRATPRPPLVHRRLARMRGRRPRRLGGTLGRVTATVDRVRRRRAGDAKEHRRKERRALI